MSLKNKKIAILATDGFEKSELFEPFNKLKDEGAIVEIVSNKSGEIKSWDNGNWGKTIAVDKKIEDANQSDYNALVLPGGVMNPDFYVEIKKRWLLSILSLRIQNRLQPSVTPLGY